LKEKKQAASSGGSGAIPPLDADRSHAQPAVGTSTAQPGLQPANRYHGPDKWVEDTHRQRVLERAGWVFWRCFASSWIRRKDELLRDLLNTMHSLGIEPCASQSARSSYTEQRRIAATEREGAVSA